MHQKFAGFLRVSTSFKTSFLTSLNFLKFMTASDKFDRSMCSHLNIFKIIKKFKGNVLSFKTVFYSIFDVFYAQKYLSLKVTKFQCPHFHFYPLHIQLHLKENNFLSYSIICFGTLPVNALT